MRSWMGGLIGFAVLCGCDSAPAPPPAVVQQSQNDAATQQSRPTTQELLTGQYVKLTLPGLPLSVRIPTSWKLGSAATISFLEGPVPSSEHDAVIQFASRGNLPADRFDAVVDRMKKEAEQAPGPLKRIDSRTVGNLLILERLYMGTPITSPKLDFRDNPVLDAQGNAITITSTPLHWNLSVFISEAGGYSRYDLNAIGLSAEQYPAERELLEKILYSLAYEAAPATAPAEKTQ
jgi:hypothetical protein